ncbi:MAG: MBL fold metallo-hydrolase [Alphaproteobacteria bacterium]|nr:MBL fold metallo-hydrolase [Alphaproteobacteria bacterium]
MGFPGIHTIRGLMGVCHLLVDRDGAILLDTGLVGEPWLIRQRVARLGLTPDAIRAILLTHGHLDHAGNLAWAAQWCGAPVYAHPLEQAHIDGTYPYVGVNTWCGRLERAGRALFRNGKPARIEVAVQDGDELPFWGGLKVVHLPGHTLGHCGFHSAKHDLLFSGDLFASYFFNVHLPPPILNSAPELIPESLEKARRLNPRLMVPQHYDVLDGTLHRRRFDRLMARHAKLPSAPAA